MGVRCYVMSRWGLWWPAADGLKSFPPWGMNLCQLESHWVLFLSISPGSAFCLHTGSISGWQDVMTAVPGIKCRQELAFLEPPQG